MGAFFSRASQEVLDMTQELIEEYHPHLTDMRIGILMKSDDNPSKRVKYLGKVRKVTAEEQAYIPFDFLITLSYYPWKGLSEFQQRALLDHELCHCKVRKEKPILADHDFEEFRVIIERYGFWWPHAEQDKEVFQATLGLSQAKLGVVAAVDMDTMLHVAQLGEGDEGFDEDDPEFDPGRNPYRQEEEEPDHPSDEPLYYPPGVAADMEQEPERDYVADLTRWEDGK